MEDCCWKTGEISCIYIASCFVLSPFFSVCLPLLSFGSLPFQQHPVLQHYPRSSTTMLAISKRGLPVQSTAKTKPALKPADIFWTRSRFANFNIFTTSNESNTEVVKEEQINDTDPEWCLHCHQIMPVTNITDMQWYLVNAMLKCTLPRRSTLVL